MISQIREIFNHVLSDVYIYEDVCGKEKAGKSTGFGVELVAETFLGTMYVSDSHVCNESSNDADKNVPRQIYNADTNDVNKVVVEATSKLLTELSYGATVDYTLQKYCILMMLLADDVAKSLVTVSMLSKENILFLRDINFITGTFFDCDSVAELHTLIQSHKKQELPSAQEKETPATSFEPPSELQTKMQKKSIFLRVKGLSVHNLTRSTF